jgi:hypothetical protein
MYNVHALYSMYIPPGRKGFIIGHMCYIPTSVSHSHTVKKLGIAYREYTEQSNGSEDPSQTLPPPLNFLTPIILASKGKLKAAVNIPPPPSPLPSRHCSL